MVTRRKHDVILCIGYAYQGDIEKIKELTVAMKEQSIFPGHGTYCSLLDSISRGGHHDKLPEVCDITILLYH